MSETFSQQSIRFLADLKAHNEKAWFKAHEDEYRQHVLAPMLALVEALAEPMLDIDSELVTAPAIGKTVSRIYRDTRFSKDKSPFRDHMWFTFKRTGMGWQDEPGFFFEIAPEHFLYGMGLYHATRETMDAFRGIMETRPETFRAAIAFLKDAEQLSVAGDQYKRTLNPDIPADLQPWYQRKSFHLFCKRPIENRLFSKGFAAELTAEYQLMAPFYRFIWDVKKERG